MKGPVGQEARTGEGHAAAEGLEGQSKLELARELRTTYGRTELARALLEVAARDDVEAIVELALAYAEGDWGVVEDAKKCFHWTNLAALAGSAYAAWTLAHYYGVGKGCEVSVERHLHWKERALASGDPLTHIWLRMPTGSEEMIGALTKLAEGGSLHAQNQLGTFRVMGTFHYPTMQKGVEWLTKAAERNRTQAQYVLGEAYREGNGVKRDLAKAFYWHERAAIQGVVNSMLRVYQGYRDGWVKGKNSKADFARAAVWLWRAWRGGSAQAKERYAALPLKARQVAPETFDLELVEASKWWESHGLAFDTDESFSWLEAGSARKVAWSQYRLSRCYHKGEFVSRDVKRAFERISSSAEQGYPQAQLALSSLFFSGQGVAKNVTAATGWAMRASVQNCDGAAQMLAWCLCAAPDREKVLSMFQMHANAGYPHAQHVLGYCYATGQGVERDDAKAVEWFARAAKKGYTPAQVMLGVWLKRGLGVKKDEAKAAEWFAKAAESNDMDGVFQLGVCRMKGQGVAQDADKGVRLFLRASRKEDPFAARCGVACGAAGLGMPKDETEALRLHNMSVCEGGKGTLAEVRAMGRDPMRVIDDCEVFASLRPVLKFCFMDCL
jgi:TPR repeat protein